MPFSRPTKPALPNASYASSNDDVLALEVREALVRWPAVFGLGQKAHSALEEHRGKCDLGSTFFVVGGRATFEIDGTILDQWDTSCGCAQIIADFQSDAQLATESFDYGGCQVK